MAWLRVAVPVDAESCERALYSTRRTLHTRWEYEQADLLGGVIARRVQPLLGADVSCAIRPAADDNADPSRRAFDVALLRPTRARGAEQGR